MFTWTLTILLYGTTVGLPPTISTDMKFVSEETCKEVQEHYEKVLSFNRGSKAAVFCVPTPGRE